MQTTRLDSLGPNPAKRVSYCSLMDCTEVPILTSTTSSPNLKLPTSIPTPIPTKRRIYERRPRRRRHLGNGRRRVPFHRSTFHPPPPSRRISTPKAARQISERVKHTADTTSRRCANAAKHGEQEEDGGQYAESRASIGFEEYYGS